MKKIILSVIVLILIASLLVACSGESVIDEALQERLPITSESVEKHMVKETFLSLGRISPIISIAIDGAQGIVESIEVEPGQRVEKGDVLFKLDKDSLEYNFNTTESQLRTIRDNLYLQYSDLTETLENQKALYNQGAISRSQLDQTQTLFEQTRKQYLDAVTAYDNQVDNIQSGIDDRTVVSPISGKVAIIYIKENENVGNQVAMEIIDDESVVAVAEVNANRINRLSIGQTAIVYPDGNMDNEVMGKVVRFNELPDSATGLYEVEIEIDNEEHRLRSGEYVEIDFIVDERESITVSKSAVRRVGENDIVFVIEDGKAYAKVIEMGITQGDQVEILSGIEEGMFVALRGNAYLSDGVEVTVVE
jgi:RND family efflux transporter MFP subunit